MLKNSAMDHLKGFFLVCFAGTLWSFGALIIRYMVEARNYQWQYLCGIHDVDTFFTKQLGCNAASQRLPEHAPWFYGWYRFNIICHRR